MNKLNKRRFLQLGAAGFAAAGVSGVGFRAQAQARELMVSAGGGDWGEMLRKAYYEPYTAQSGVKISAQPYMDLAGLKAMVESQAWGQTDVLFTAAADAAMAAKLGLVEPLDYTGINRDDLIPGAANDHWLLANVAAVCLGWNTDAIKGDDVPKNWQDFFDPARKAPMALWKNASQTLEIAALGAGVPLDQLYPLNVDKALGVLEAVRDQIRWYEGGAQSQQLISSGEVDLAALWINRADALVKDGLPVNFLKSGTIMDGDALVIPKGHPKKAEAMAYIAYMAGPEPQARMTELVAVGTTNTKSVNLITPEKLAGTPTDPAVLGTNRFQDFDWLAENTQQMTDAFNKWLLG